MIEEDGLLRDLQHRRTIERNPAAVYHGLSGQNRGNGFAPGNPRRELMLSECSTRFARSSLTNSYTGCRADDAGPLQCITHLHELSLRAVLLFVLLHCERVKFCHAPCAGMSCVRLEYCKAAAPCVLTSLSRNSKTDSGRCLQSFWRLHLCLFLIRQCPWCV